MAEATLALRLAPTFENVDKVRRTVRDICRDRYRQAGAAALSDDLLLAIAEAMNNAVEHSHAAEMEIEFVAKDRAVVFRMSTAGAPFDPTVDASFPDIDAVPEGGFGRALIAALTDRVSYEYLQGKNILTLEKQLTKEKRDGD